MRDRPTRAAANAAQHRPGGNPCGREHDVALGHFFNRETALGVGMAHRAHTLNLLIRFIQQAPLHLAADTAQRRRCQHAFRRATRPKIDIDLGIRHRRRDHPVHVAIADQHDPSAGFPALGDQVLVTVTVQDARDKVGDFALLCFCQIAKIGGDRIVQADDSGRQTSAHRDLVHVDIGCVQKVAMFGQCDRGQRIRASLGGQRRALQWIDRDVHAGTAGADLLTDIQHRRFVHLAFADHHRAVDRHRVERLAHGFHRRAVGLILLALADPMRGRQSRRLGHAHQFQREVAVGHLAGARLVLVGHEFLLSRC